MYRPCRREIGPDHLSLRTTCAMPALDLPDPVDALTLAGAREAPLERWQRNVFEIREPPSSVEESCAGTKDVVHNVGRQVVQRHTADDELSGALQACCLSRHHVHAHTIAHRFE